MKKSLVLALMITLSFTSCKKDVEMDNDEVAVDSTAVEMVSDDHNAMNSLDYQGTYVGSLPCADCESIETILILTDGSYIRETVYKGKSKEIFNESGNIEWNKEGNTITLVGLNTPNQYFVGENILFHLDVNGKRIEGDLASKYELKKELKSVGKIELKNSKWKLIKLYGKDVENLNEDKLKGITFNPDGRMSAFAGCNSMGGNYEINEEISKIKFSKVFSTKMACQDMTTEKELTKVLEIADNYYFDGNLLKLNKGKMATLAEFVIIK
ncbi:copper resistance protein NlpE N-terminal domain-containing protein [uncultured Flavobacterium sp.]|uniref:copper resistance protein NlpE N-terminal domain-containing protein n=1 Tax=uncultured Flavobacterium sp. TaxID=165435 RepID=UPI0030C8418A